MPDKQPTVIIVTGYPCTGKTTLGLRIAREFHLPFISKDGIKELLFDSLGWSDRQWSKRLGFASYELMFYFLEAQLAAGRSAIVESNFYPEQTNAKFLALQEAHGYKALQILCVTAGGVLYQRFKQRSESGERHPGHVDHQNYEEFSQTLLRGRLEPLAIGGTLIEVDTTDFSLIDYASILAAVGAALSR